LNNSKRQKDISSRQKYTTAKYKRKGTPCASQMFTFVFLFWFVSHLALLYVLRRSSLFHILGIITSLSLVRNHFRHSL
jgi:hypothetical protein